MPPDREKGVFMPPFLVDDAAAQDELAQYQGAIRSMDSAVGRILTALAEDRAQNENTIVVFTTDHGIPFPRAKCSVYDPGLEISLLIRWHANGIHAGQTLPSMIPNIDILPSLLDLAGVPLPSGGPPIMGRSFAPLVTGRPYTPRSDLFCGMTYHDYYDPLRAIRTDRWKLIVSFCYNLSFMDPSQEWRPRCITRVPADPSQTRHELVELYDLQADPHETRNLVGDAAHVETKTDLLRRLGAFMHETNDPLLKGVPPSPIHHMALDVIQRAGAP
jgi:arylsulfatase A-like enzyme